MRGAHSLQSHAGRYSALARLAWNPASSSDGSAHGLQALLGDRVAICGAPHVSVLHGHHGGGGAHDQVDGAGHARTLRRAGETDDGRRRAGEQPTTVRSGYWHRTNMADVTAATTIRPRLEPTVVRGSVIIKKMKSWYIGPVIGATSASSGVPTSALRAAASSR